MSKKRALTFPLLDLLLVRDGIKTQTLRFDQRLKDTAPGDIAHMRFGAYDKPVIIDAPIVRVERVDFNALTEAEADGARFTQWLQERYDWLHKHRPLDLLKCMKIKDSPDYEALVRVCEELGQNPFELWNTAEETERPVMTVIWWELAPEDRTPIPEGEWL